MTEGQNPGGLDPELRSRLIERAADALCRLYGIADEEVDLHGGWVDGAAAVVDALDITRPRGRGDSIVTFCTTGGDEVPVFRIGAVEGE